MKRFFTTTAIAVVLLSTGACVKAVPSGYVGVKVNNMQGGVQQTPAQTGWHFLSFGEEMHLYPTTQKVYSYSRKGEEGGVNEELQFTDHIGLQLTADVAVTIRVDASKAPYLFAKYRMDTDDFIHGPVRTAVRSAIKQSARQYTSEQLYTGAESTVAQEALAILQSRYAKEGIEIIAIDFLGNIRYPETVLNAITLKTEKIQLAEAAKADEARAIAQGRATVAKAEADATATRVMAEALRANPEVVSLRWIEKWDGALPSTMTGSGTALMVTPR